MVIPSFASTSVALCYLTCPWMSLQSLKRINQTSWEEGFWLSE